MGIFASRIEKPPRFGFHWFDGSIIEFDVNVQRDEDDVPHATGGDLILVEKGRFLTRTYRKESQSELIPDIESIEASYDPLVEHSGLFRNFATLEPSEETILEFASRYGWLGNSSQHVTTSEMGKMTLKLLKKADWEWTPDTAMSRYGFLGENFEIWESEIFCMRALVALWDALRFEDHEFLDQTIHESEGIIWYDCGRLPNAEWQYKAPIRLMRYGVSSEDLQPNDTLALGWKCIRQEIGNALDSSGVRLRLSGEGGDLSMGTEISTLSSAMWLQFALAIAGNKQYEHCIHCQGNFEIGPSAARKGKQYCSNACRMAAYRLRRSKRS